MTVLPQSEGLLQTRRGEEKLLGPNVPQRRAAGFAEMSSNVSHEGEKICLRWLITKTLVDKWTLTSILSLSPQCSTPT